MSNITEEFCHKEIAPDAPPVFQNGRIVLQAYHIGWIISGSLALIAIITSFWLISRHLQWYTNKREQRYIVRLLFMVPLYALISFCSFLFWNHATPIILVRDAYEAIVLTAFFYLLLMYISHDVEEQKRVFVKKGLSVEADAVAIRNGEEVTRWMFPLGFIKWKPKDGLYFLQLMKWGVLQYCVIRPTTTLAAVILDYMGLYCENSWGLGWGHIYITIIMSISVTIAMYCLIQIYVPISKDIAKHKPLLKLFSVKAVVFLTFWQATFLSVLSMFGIVKANKYMTVDDVNTGIGAVLETLEMTIFAFLHIKAFTYKPYQEATFDKLYPNEPSVRTPQLRSLGHAMDYRETFREIWVGCIYMLDKMRGKEPTPDFGVIRESHYESAFGRSRPISGKAEQLNTGDHKEMPKDPTFPTVSVGVDRETEIRIEGERQWLALDRYDRGTNLPRRERSEGLQEQIDHELQRLGYPTLRTEDRQVSLPTSTPRRDRRRSWWHSFYNHFSQSGYETEEPEKEPLKRRRFSLLRSYNDVKNNGGMPNVVFDTELDDPPPTSMLHPHRVFRSHNSIIPPRNRDDHGMPIYENESLLLSPCDDSYGRYPTLPLSPSSLSPQGGSRLTSIMDDGHHNPSLHRVSNNPRGSALSHNPNRPTPEHSPFRDNGFEGESNGAYLWAPPPVPPKPGSSTHNDVRLDPPTRQSRHIREPAVLPGRYRHKSRNINIHTGAYEYNYSQFHATRSR